ncbi:Condensin complex subunit, partial [Ceratobasidium sp. 414]
MKVTWIRVSNDADPYLTTTLRCSSSNSLRLWRKSLTMGGFQLINENNKLQNLDTYSIPNELDVADLDERGITGALEGAVEVVALNQDAIAEPEVFDVYRSLLKYSERLVGSHLSKMLDSLLSGFQAEAEATSRDLEADDNDSFPQHRTALEMYAFLLHWFSVTADKAPPKPEEGAAAAKPKRGKGKAASKKASNQAEVWSWPHHVPHVLALVAKVLRVNLGRLWVSSGDRRTFIDTLTRPAYAVTQSDALMKDEGIRYGVYKAICLAVKHHDHASSAQVLIIQSLQLHEHLAEPMAEVLTVLSKEFDYPQLAEAVLREVANKTFNAQDTKTPRSFSKFLVLLTSEAPRLVLKQFSLVSTQIDSESYTMRMGLVEVFGMLVKEVAEDQEYPQELKEKLLNKLFDTLISRFLDNSTYVRARLLATLTRLCDLQNKFPAQRLRMTEAVVYALKDRASTVRRNAVVLLTKLVLTHPYAILHGGPLDRDEWEAGYEKVSKDLEVLGAKELEKIEAEVKDEKKEGADEKMEVDRNEEEEGEEGEGEEEEEEEEGEGEEDGEEMGDGENGSPTPRRPKSTKRSKKPKVEPKRQSDAIDLAMMTEEQLDGNSALRLKFTKRYYADALNFIRHVEMGMESVNEILSSTYKAETLEAIEFFRVAHEYKLKGTDSGIKKMLHLIWNKDTGSTTEDGKEVKGVRLKLIECYRSLYFDPVAGLDAHSQINRIAKNMIELTYNTTVGELTSLEELMRTMTDDNQVHPDVANKLWQVYAADKDILKAQRRGAIVILGMIAVARREVVTERIDTLLNIGLGPFGKADLVLARYTCVALQRVSGSHKKVKGSLIDKSTRLPMDNVIFARLRDTIEYPTSSKEWFGMAEQAINTIYVLGEQPDTLCTELIKIFTRRVFAAQPQPRSPTQAQDNDVEMDPDESTQPDRRSRAGSVPTMAPEAPAASRTVALEQSNDTGNVFHLSQLVFIVGHVALKHVVHLELVEREWKRRNEAAKAEKRPAKNAKEQDEIEQVAGNAEDDIGDTIQNIRERELLYGPTSLLALYGPMIIDICGKTKLYKEPNVILKTNVSRTIPQNQTLRAAATLALSKLMCVSSQFCENNLMLLFKIMETSRNPVIKSNIVIALGDVAISFNNMIDENSNRLYDGLTDHNLTVKKNTLMVLTHLILNGMIKVKGQLGEMAKCLEDEDPRVADLAKLFFQELSLKDNAIYNNLPD